MSLNCGRCGTRLGSHWSETWPNFGRITVGRHSQSWRGFGLDHWKTLSDHPAVVDDGAQHVVIEWQGQELPPKEWENRKDEGHSGITGTVDGPLGGAPYHVSFETADKTPMRRPNYSLCLKCQDKFLAVLAEFFQIVEANP